MKARGWLTALLAAALAAAGGSGCTALMAHGITSVAQDVPKITADHSLQAHAVKSIKTLQISRIAVMPIIDAPDVLTKVGSKELVQDAGEVVTAELYSQCALAGGWDVVPQVDVRQAMQQLPPTTPRNLDQNAVRLGKQVGADAVLYGQVERYQERVGYDYSAAHPASVAFALKFVDIRNGRIVWHATFAKSQKALNQNVFDLVNFVQTRARWVRAHEIAMEGVKEAVANLHGNLNLEAHVKRFETSTYGQLKSGGQRYNGRGGLY